MSPHRRDRRALPVQGREPHDDERPCLDGRHRDDLRPRAEDVAGTRQPVDDEIVRGVDTKGSDGITDHRLAQLHGEGPLVADGEERVRDRSRW